MTKEETQNNTPEKSQEPRKQVSIPLLQHRGVICEPLINVGDEVLIGQKIGETNNGFPASIHASIAGCIKIIEEKTHPSTSKKPSIVIESDETNKTIKFKSSQNPKKEYTLNTLRDSGIIELNGYPLYNTLNSGKIIDTVLVNLTNPSDAGSNCTQDNISKIINGTKLLIEASDAQQGIFIAHKKDKQLINSLKSELNIDNIKIIDVKQHYTPFMSNLLAHDMTGMRISNMETPADAGVIVTSACSTLAASKAVFEGIPQISVNVAVSGKITEPCIKNIPIGTSFKEIIQSCGGYKGEPGKIIMNGILDGIAQITDEVPVIKSTTEIAVQSPEDTRRSKPGPCIHCAQCVDVCPVNILPTRLAAFADLGRYDECEKLNIQSCVECGRCTYVCPSNIHLLQLIRYAKVALSESFAMSAEKESPNLTLGCCSAKASSSSTGGKK